MKPQTRFVSSALAAVALAAAPTTLQGLEVAGSLLIDLEADDYTTGAVLWPQSSVTDLPGNFFPAGTPTVQNVAGATAIVFDGKDEFFTGPLTTGSTLEAAGGPYSVEVWAYQGNARWEEALVSWSRRGGPDGTFLGSRYGLHPAWGAWASWGGAGDMGFAPQVGDEGSPPAYGEWHLLTYTYDGTTKRIYVDGVLNDQEAGTLDAKDANPVLIGTERENDGNITGNDQIFFSGGINKVRIHSGTLSDTQVSDNYAEEIGAFGGLSAATSLPLPPIHRWSFNDPATGAPDGTVLVDSIGAAPAVVRGGVAFTGTDAAFTGTALSLPGGSAASEPYVDLPNGVISKNTAVTIEFWSTSTGNLNWSRLLSLGTSTGGANPGEITSPGGDFNGKQGLWLTNNMGTGTDQEFNRGGGASPNGGLQRGTIRSSATGTQFHHAVVYDPVLLEWRWYRNGQLMAVIPDTEGPTDIDDVNNWFGRSGWSGDANFQGELNEFRIYNYALTESQVYLNTLDGPDTLTTDSSGAAFTWTPTAAGPFNFDNAGSEDNWSTGPGGTFPNAINDTANLVSDLIDEQDVMLNAPVTLGTLNIGDPDGTNSFTLLPGTAGSLTMQASVGNAAINQQSGAWDTFISAPLTLNSDTVVSNPSNGFIYLADQITGSADLIKTGSGEVMITGDSAGYSGNVQVLSGNLVIGDDTTTGSISAASFIPTLPGRLAFNRADDISIAPTVTGSGSFEHRGGGMLTLGTGTSLTHTWDFDTISGSGDFIIEGTATVNGPRNFRIENNTILRGDCTISIAEWFSVGIGSGGTCLMQDNVSLTADGDFNVGDVGIGQSLFTLESGTVSCSNFFIGKNTGTDGVMLQSGGTVTKTGGGDGRIGANGTDVWGAYHMSGGSFANNAGNFQVGASGIGVMEIDGGATASAANWPVIGRYEADGGIDSYGMLDVKDGSFTATGEANWMIIGEEGNGVLNVRGSGAVVCNNGLRIGAGSDVKPGSGTVNLLAGGTITADIIDQANNDFADGTLNLDGGTIVAGAPNATFLEGLDNAYVRAGGVTIDSNGNDITVAQALLAPAGNGVTSIPVTDPGTGYLGAPFIEIIDGGGSGATAVANLDGSGGIDSITITNPGSDYTSTPTINFFGGGDGFGVTIDPPTLAANSSGGLTKSGLGALYLNGANTYTGATTVDGGTLGGTGSVAGALLVNAGSTIAPGTSAGTFSVGGDATIDGTYECEIDGAIADRLDVAGMLTITNATLNITELAAPTEAVYIIASYGSLTGTGFVPPVTGLPVGYVIDYNYGAANQIALVSTSGTDYDSWAAGFPGFVDTAPGSDPDGDGLSNEDEYAFGLDPTSGASVSPVSVPLDKTAGTFTYSRRDPALTGLVYSYEWSINLDGTWTPVVPAVADLVTPIGGTDNQSVTVNLTGAPGDPLANAKLFVRVAAQ